MRSASAAGRAAAEAVHLCPLRPAPILPGVNPARPGLRPSVSHPVGRSVPGACLPSQRGRACNASDSSSNFQAEQAIKHRRKGRKLIEGAREAAQHLPASQLTNSRQTAQAKYRELMKGTGASVGTGGSVMFLPDVNPRTRTDSYKLNFDQSMPDEECEALLAKYEELGVEGLENIEDDEGHDLHPRQLTLYFIHWLSLRHDKLEGEEADQLSRLAAKLVDLRMGLRPKSNAKLVAAARALAARAYELDPNVSLPPGLEAACSTEWALNPVNLSTLQIHPADIRRQLADVQEAVKQLSQANTEDSSAPPETRGSSSEEQSGGHAGLDDVNIGGTHKPSDESTAASLCDSQDGDVSGEAGVGLKVGSGAGVGADVKGISDEPSLSLTEAQAMLVMAKRAEFMLSPEGVAMVKQKSQAFDQEVKKRRKASAERLMGQISKPIKKPAYLAASVTEQILDYLLTITDDAERSALLPDAFTPIDEDPSSRASVEKATADVDPRLISTAGAIDTERLSGGQGLVGPGDGHAAGTEGDTISSDSNPLDDVINAGASGEVVTPSDVVTLSSASAPVAGTSAGSVGDELRQAGDIWGKIGEFVKGRGSGEKDGVDRMEEEDDDAIVQMSTTPMRLLIAIDLRYSRVRKERQELTPKQKAAKEASLLAIENRLERLRDETEQHVEFLRAGDSKMRRLARM